MFRSRQRVDGGGKFKSEQQRKFMWAVDPVAARKWAHNLHTNKLDWTGNATNVNPKRITRKRRG